MVSHIKRRDAWNFIKSDNSVTNTSDYAGRIEEATNNAFYRVFRFDNLEKARYEIRMRCSAKDGKSLRHVNKVYWVQLTQIIYDDFMHPGKASLELRLWLHLN